ncbi:MAG: hypothetical protein EOO07_03800 [Chitinophagaceae bacterium]|nr:MAG: hypothetical protein EOO07_03800 [Chitinophagaceae bacterium]
MKFYVDNEIASILIPRFEKSILSGLYGGRFSVEKDKFYASTLVKIADVNYEDFAYSHRLFNGHSSGFHDLEKTKKYLDSNTWQHKSMEECVVEGVYTYFSVLFIGMQFANEWFILKELSFYGNLASEGQLRQHIEQYLSFDSELFLPKLPFETIISGKRTAIRAPEFEEFATMPYLVAIIKQEKKAKINTLFSNYFHEEYIAPFFLKLKILFPTVYTAFDPLRQGFTLIFAEHKNDVIVAALVKDSDDKWRLTYFLFDRKTGRFFKWVYFTSATYTFSFFYGDVIINDLKQISNWDHDGFLDSSCTMDDANFLSEFVYKMEDGNYLFLEEIKL